MSSRFDLQAQLDDILGHRPHPRSPQARAALAPVAPATATRRPFSAFRLTDVYRANQLAAQLMEIDQARRSSGGEDRDDAVETALDEAARALATEDPELVKHAVKLYLTHYPHGTALRIRSLEAREPLKVLPSLEADASGTLAASAIEANPELRLAWWREDPKLNEHHEHWHVVYDIVGVPAPGKPLGGQPKDRQGELFFYMHRQMVARYTAERLALGMESPVQWYPYDEVFDPYGYDPGPYLSLYYRPRGPNLSWQDIPDLPDPNSPEYAHRVARIAEQHDHLWEAATAKYFVVRDQDNQERHVPLDVNALGSTQEADIGSVECIPFSGNDAGIEAWLGAASQGYYGDWHNDGHDLFAYMGIARDDPQAAGYQGVMVDTACAVRDPLFFRWHQHVDDLFDAYQHSQPPNDFSDAPPVQVRASLPGVSQPAENGSPDIILCFAKSIPATWEGRWQEFGEESFGGAHWDTDFSSGAVTTDELQTQMHTRAITIEPGVDEPGRREESHTIAYLDQKPFVYFLRVENLVPEDKDVTARIFLVPQAAAHDRRLWIEMDKFRHHLKPKERAVICRPAALSSVIRKPAVKPPQASEPPVQAEDSQDQTQDDAVIEENYCDCGWPYNLLLPRGRQDGMPFRLLVIFTDWELDRVPDDSHCGSMSYCGARDRYPDRRPMGYPFDRPFPDAAGRSISEVIAGQINMAARDIVIRWLLS